MQYAIHIGSSKIASSFHNASFCLVAFPWNKSRTDCIRDFWWDDSVTSGAVLISVEEEEEITGLD